MGSLSQKLPDLLPLLPLLPLSAPLAGFSVALGVALGVPVALAVASSPFVLLLVGALPVGFSFPVALVASFLVIFRKAIFVPDLSSLRSVSMPAATRRGSTSLMRLHSHRADFGHALSLATSTPCASAISLRRVCNVEEVSEHSSCSSMSLMIACATGDPSSVAWFCTLTTSSQSLRNVSAPQPMAS